MGRTEMAPTPSALQISAEDTASLSLAGCGFGARRAPLSLGGCYGKVFAALGEYLAPWACFAVGQNWFSLDGTNAKPVDRALAPTV